jgi:hypothetical protein
MSFSSTMAAAPKVLSGGILKGSLLATGRTVSVVIGAGLLAAIYQTASDEARLLLGSIRTRSKVKQVRYETVLLNSLGSELPVELQTELLKARNPFKIGLAMLTKPEISAEHKAIIRVALQSATAALKP